VRRARRAPSSTSSSRTTSRGRDDFQRKGIGTELLRRCLQAARDEKLTNITSSDVLPENHAIQRLAERLGFSSIRLPDGRIKLLLTL
jgi:GNAT superfamily N-acetyltransferase